MQISTRHQQLLRDTLSSAPRAEALLRAVYHCMDTPGVESQTGSKMPQEFGRQPHLVLLHNFLSGP